jgi:hypothetical protein
MTTYSDSLKLTLIGDGEQTNVWGSTTNTNLGTLIEQAIVGVATIAMSGSGDRTLTNFNGASDEARNAVLIITGASSGGYSVILPAGQQKTYIVTNSLTSGSVTIKPSGGTGASIPNGVTMVIYTDGTSTQAVNYVATAGTAALATNLSAGSANTVVYQSAAGSTAYLTPGTAGYVLKSGGPSAIPYWDQAGTAALASNLASGAAGQIPYQSGTNTTAFTLTGTTGQFLKSNGTATPTWETIVASGGTVTSVSGSGGSTGLTFTGSPITTSGTLTLGGTLAVGSGGTGASSLASAGIAQLGSTNSFTGTNNYSSVSPIIMTSSTNDDQRLKVTNGTFTTGISPTTVQLGVSGAGAIYFVGGAFDGGNGLGFIQAGQSIQLSSSGNMFTSAPTCFKTGSTTAWDIYSDSRIKKNVTPYTKGLAELNQVQIKNFEFNGLGNSTEGDKGLGVIADEIEKVLPNTVKTIPTKLHPEDQERIDLKTFNSTELVYLLVNAVKELNAKVDAQAAQIAALKG